MEFLVAHSSILFAAVSVFGGLWAAFHRLDLLLRARMQEHFASKSDIEKVNAKLDVILSAVSVVPILKRPNKKG